MTMSTSAERGSTAPVAELVRRYIVDNSLMGHDSGFGNQDSLLEAGIIDSTAIMDVVAFLERRFGIAVDDEDLVADNLDSIGRIARFVERKLSVKTAV